MRDSNQAQALTSHIHTLERTRDELRSRLEYIDTTLEKCRLWLEETDDGQTGFTELVSNFSEIADDFVSKSRNDSVDEGVLSDKESETCLSELKTQLEAYQQDQKVEQISHSVLNCKCYKLLGEQEALLLDKHTSETHKELLKCNKNPEHAEFLSLPSLKLDHLPIEYRDKNMLDFVKVMGDLTVQVTLNIESFPAKGRQKLKYGTGVITSVLKQFSTCEC
ncbi:STE20-like serine/threonine-protein kinase isoform X2 [Biomphalaria pfeifferi]|uniref:STE20-like serine/threonine-protein kinase isoform X2 n=1 Tax=Biomphalaria pfeifferi TaxID=112525 RepID=A0AAD8AU39_BIOPF|nr:STE20-like serine/threonine-protein kinase isoform X2 [Biomphalaria pfeifferi]